MDHAMLAFHSGPSRAGARPFAFSFAVAGLPPAVLAQVRQSRAAKAAAGSDGLVKPYAGIALDRHWPRPGRIGTLFDRDHEPANHHATAGRGLFLFLFVGGRHGVR